MSERLNSPRARDVPEQMAGAYSSIGNRHTYLKDERGKSRVISRAKFNENFNPPTTEEILKPSEVLSEHIDIRSLARRARQARKAGDKKAQFAFEDEIQERLIQHAERGGWDNQTTDAALEYFIDIIYNVGPEAAEFAAFEVSEDDGIVGSGVPESDPEEVETDDAPDDEPTSVITPPIVIPLPASGASAGSGSGSGTPLPAPLIIPAPSSSSSGSGPAGASASGGEKKGIRHNKFLRGAIKKLGAAALISAVVLFAKDRDLTDVKLYDNVPAPSGTPIATPARTETAVEGPAYVVAETAVSTPQQAEAGPTGTSTAVAESTATANPTKTPTVTPEATATETGGNTAESTSTPVATEATQEEVGSAQENTPTPEPTAVAETGGISTPSSGGGEETTTLQPQEEGRSQEEMISYTERESIDVTVPVGGGITHVLKEYMTNEIGIGLKPEQLYALYNYLVCNYDISKLLTDVTFITLPNGDVGIEDPGPAKITPAGQDAIDVWLDENVWSRSK